MGTKNAERVAGTTAAAGPEVLLAVLDNAQQAVAALPETSPVRGDRAGWAEVVRAAQRVIDAATAAQDAAIARLAAIEPEELPDGTVVESHRAPGHTALDAPALVSGVLAVSAAHAEHRVRAAVRLAADGPAGSDTATGLGGLHEAMRAGRLDGYRAGVLAQELEQAPAPVRGHHRRRPGAPLRRTTTPRTCAAAAGACWPGSAPTCCTSAPRRARAESGLRRWADEPGVDHWEGTFPSEDAARAWAALDALAQPVPHERNVPHHRPGPRQGADRPRRRPRHHRHHHHPDHPRRHRRNAAGCRCRRHSGTRPRARRDDPAAAVSRARPGRAPQPGREAGPGGAARSSGAARPGAAGPGRPRRPVRQPGATSSRSPACVPGNHTLVPLSWVTHAMAAGASVRTARCHPETGALLPDSHAGTDTEATDPSGSGPYRPSRALAALVRQRDGRCRFPGCRSPPGSATSTTSDPGPPAPPAPTTCSASAAATTASSNATDGPPGSPPTPS